MVAVSESKWSLLPNSCVCVCECNQLLLVDFVCGKGTSFQFEWIDIERKSRVEKEWKSKWRFDTLAVVWAHVHLTLRQINLLIAQEGLENYSFSERHFVLSIQMYSDEWQTIFRVRIVLVSRLNTIFAEQFDRITNGSELVAYETVEGTITEVKIRIQKLFSFNVSWTEFSIFVPMKFIRSHYTIIWIEFLIVTSV